MSSTLLVPLVKQSEGRTLAKFYAKFYTDCGKATL